MNRLKCINIKGIPILEQLHLEELLLRHTKDNWFIISNGHSIPTIVLGLSGKVKELVDVDRVCKDKIPLVRRFTGGGTVIIDHSTVFATFIMNAKDVPCAPYPRDIMKWSETHVYGSVFKDCRVNRTSNHCQTFSLREHDYVFDDMKFGGNAQSITKDRWIHHTSFLWDYNPENMRYLKMPSKKPDYRGDRDHTAFLTKLKHYIDTQEDFYNKVISTLSESFVIDVVDPAALRPHVEQILNGRDIHTLSRSKLERIEEYLETASTTATLVHTGPSCGLNI